MILYSIVPHETVFEGFKDSSSVIYFEAEYKGEKVLVARMADKHCEISRLLSTRPSSYLDPSFQPGRVVDERDLN